MSQREQPFRLASGGRIDRGEPLAFSFDGKRFTGYRGDTLASALLANGVRLLGRSFKYHRPRGILTAGSEEPNALVSLNRGARLDPNTKATMVELQADLEAASQNRWPSLRFDLMAASSLFSPLLVAGFYYKTFMWPAAFWEKLYEPAIRRIAGLGSLSGEADPDRYEKAHAFCDVLVVGAGPAGLAAALTAARGGARVILCEEDFLAGGRLLSERHRIDGLAAAQWVEQAIKELRDLPNVRLMLRTAVFGVYDGQVHAALERAGDAHQRYWKIVSQRTVLATGAIERPLVFAGNDRPGIMMASAAQTYLGRFAVKPGSRTVVFTTTDSGWSAARDLLAEGVMVAAVLDTRLAPGEPVMRPLREAGVECLPGAAVTGTRGRHALKSIEAVDRGGRLRRFDADLLAVSGGWSPNIALACHLGARPAWSATISAYTLKNAPRHITLAGAAAGRFSLADALLDGTRVGGEVAASCGFKSPPMRTPAATDDACQVSAWFSTRPSTGRAFVDLQHDVTDRDIDVATREGFTSMEHLKRYTTLGMATDQGRTSNVNGSALLAAATGRTIADTGTVLARAPAVPVAIAAFAAEHNGMHFRPVRRTPSHDFAAERGAVFVNVGPWRRAQWFPLAGESHWRHTVDREVNAVRSGVGVCDVSTLGKIDVQGQDAATLLERVYVNTFASLPVGKARYGLMLREDGFVMDDGTATRLEEQHYLLTTTTANAASVMRHLEYVHQVLFPTLDVQLASVTEQWAQFAVAGPHSRRLLEQLFGTQLDLSNVAFPYMAACSTTWHGIPARLFRLSFSGELAYEIAVPARYAHELICVLMECGRALGVVPYGTEALGVMRIEKGHVGGNEINGQTTAADLGFARMMSGRKDFIGRVMALRPGLLHPDRMTLVGIKPVAPGAQLTAGAHFVTRERGAGAQRSEGHVTSVAWSPTLGHSIGLGLLRRGTERLGEHIRVFDGLCGRNIEVLVCSPQFVDPEGARLRA